MIGTFFARIGRDGLIMNALYKAVLVATLLSALGFIPITQAFDDAGPFSFWNSYGSVLIGLGVTFLLVGITEYYTGTRWGPVKSIASASMDRPRDEHHRGPQAAQATAAPVIVIVIGIVGLYYAAGQDLFGIGVAVTAQLSMTGLDRRPRRVMGPSPTTPVESWRCRNSTSRRAITDPPRDAVGNTTKAVTKGYAIGLAGLADALILFDEYTRGCDRGLETVTFTPLRSVGDRGLFIGGLMPFLFASLAMQAGRSRPADRSCRRCGDSSARSPDHGGDGPARVRQVDRHRHRLGAQGDDAARPHPDRLPGHRRTTA